MHFIHESTEIVGILDTRKMWGKIKQSVDLAISNYNFDMKECSDSVAVFDNYVPHVPFSISGRFQHRKMHFKKNRFP